MKNGLKIIDSDMHIMEPPDLWENYVDAPFKQHAPRVVNVPSRGDFNLLLLDGKEPRANSPSLANDARMIGKRRASTREDVIGFARDQGFNAKSQLEAMDIEGLDVAVLFPTACLHIMTVPDMDPLLAEAICRAYNNWLYDFCQQDPARLKGAAMLPPHDVSLAVREAQTRGQRPRVRDRPSCGPRRFRATPGSASTGSRCGRNWRQLGMPVGFHECTNSGYYPHIERFGQNNRLMRHICSHVTGQMVTMVDIIVGGVLERFPELKVAFLECNCGWAPAWLSRMDTHWSQLGGCRRAHAVHETQRVLQAPVRGRVRRARNARWARSSSSWATTTSSSRRTIRTATRSSPTPWTPSCSRSCRSSTRARSFGTTA